MNTTEQSASGLRSQNQAIEVAEGFAEMYSSNFAVIYYPSLREWDVEPARIEDTVGSSFVAYIARPVTEAS